MNKPTENPEVPTAEMIRAQHILYHESRGMSLEAATEFVCTNIALRVAWGYPPLKPIDIPDTDQGDSGQSRSVWG